MSWARPEDELRWKREFGLRLRGIRKQVGMSQMHLALAADLDPTYISGIELGRRNLSLVNIHVLAAALDVPIERLFLEPL